MGHGGGHHGGGHHGGGGGWSGGGERSHYHSSHHSNSKKQEQEMKCALMFSFGMSLGACCIGMCAALCLIAVDLKPDTLCGGITSVNRG